MKKTTSSDANVVIRGYLKLSPYEQALVRDKINEIERTDLNRRNDSAEEFIKHANESVNVAGGMITGSCPCCGM
jgi:hypothetical protein